MTKEQKENLILYRFESAEKTLKEVEIQVQNKLYNTAINRLYYACYYAVSALLLRHEVSAKTHSGAIHMFGLHFINTGIIKKTSGNFYSKFFIMRQKGDYEDYVDYKEEDVLDLIPHAEDLICQIKILLFGK